MFLCYIECFEFAAQTVFNATQPVMRAQTLPLSFSLSLFMYSAILLDHTSIIRYQLLQLENRLIENSGQQTQVSCFTFLHNKKPQLAIQCQEKMSPGNGKRPITPRKRISQASLMQNFSMFSQLTQFSFLSVTFN